MAEQTISFSVFIYSIIFIYYFYFKCTGNLFK